MTANYILLLSGLHCPKSNKVREILYYFMSRQAMIGKLIVHHNDRPEIK